MRSDIRSVVMDAHLEHTRLLQALSQCFGPSGCENDVADLVMENLDAPSSEHHRDAMGNAWVSQAAKTKNKPHVLLDAHMDEVGFMVSGVTSDGFLRFVPIGGWWSHTLLAQRVEVKTSRGDKILGTIACLSPHHVSSKQRTSLMAIDQMVIDIGALNEKQIEAIGVQVGDFAVPATPFLSMSDERFITGKAFDNRLGVAAMIESFNRCKDHTAYALTALASVQEEVGLRGIKTALASIKPDVAIVLETAPADDVLASHSLKQAALGKGPQLRLMDPTTLFNRTWCRHVQAIAKQQAIDIQLAVRATGGTNAGALHLYDKGIPCVVIGVPCRYIHTHSQVAFLPDYRATVDLVCALLNSLDDFSWG